jgi:hypothetical protein
MSKFDEVLDVCKGECDKHGFKIDADLLRGIAKSLGPSIYKADAAKVSCSDQTELDRVKANFLIKKLGLADGPKLDAAVKEVCSEMGSSNRNKYRVIFYALLAQKMGKTAMFA